jgi:hypothetical protein
LLTPFSAINVGLVADSVGYFRILAYLDPGSGSYFIQLLIASLMGGLFALGIFRKKVIHFLRNLFSSRKDEQDSDQ